MRSRLLGALLIGAVAATAALAASPASRTTPAGHVSLHAEATNPVFTPYLHLLSRSAYSTPPTTAECRDSIARSCYSPRQFRRAYHLGPLYRHGYRGRGQTIVVVVSYG